MTNFRNILGCAAILAAAGAPSALADIILFDIIGRSGPGLRVDNENHVASGTGSGGEVGPGISFDTITKVLIINAAWGSANGFTDLTGNVTIAHIHQAANALFTSNGPVIVDLDGATPGFNNSATSGGWTNTQVLLNASQEAALFNGFLYLNIHTVVNRPGEIRGNLVAIPTPGAAALLGVAGLVAMRRRRA